jgi:hypothetical protein
MWEYVNDTTQRLQVHGGWLYRTKPVMSGPSTPFAMCFVPDASVDRAN